MLSAAAIAVVSEVNPDRPGAFFFSQAKIFLTFFLLFVIFFASNIPSAYAYTSALQTRNAMNNAIYNNTLISITPMLFHHIELGMSYEAVVSAVGKPALYCDSGESYCNIENGAISKGCIDEEFIQPNKTWLCHWQGVQTSQAHPSQLEIWFVGSSVSQVQAYTEDGMIYHRDSGNTVHLGKA